MKRNRGVPFLLISVFLCGLTLLIALLSPRHEAAPVYLTDTSTPTATATLTFTPTVTHRPTFTASFTPTVTATRLPTYTSTVTLTPTSTTTASILPNRTLTETPATPDPADLDTFVDEDGTTIDWGYSRISDLTYNSSGGVENISAFFSFRLVDRSIHRFTTELATGEYLTVYYLNTTHTFDETAQTVRLVIGGEWGKDVPVADITTTGSFYLTIRELDAGDVFNSVDIHDDTTDDTTDLPDEYEEILLSDLEERLESLPDSLMVLADHPIQVPEDDYDDIEYYFTNAPYLAARYNPFVTLDEDAAITGPSTWAVELTSYLIDGEDVSSGTHQYASNVLVLMPGE